MPALPFLRRDLGVLVKLALVIPVFNEQGNLARLVTALAAARAGEVPCPWELVLVDNGSRDGSGVEIAIAAKAHDWIRTIALPDNRGYGGGVWAGLHAVSPEATHVAWWPADGQYAVSDLHRLWAATRREPDALHHGVRAWREDGFSARLVSHVYTRLARKILDLPAPDVNGLPKIFPHAFVRGLSLSPERGFLLDAQCLLAARRAGLPYRPHPVLFRRRVVGRSSWSGRRLATYLDTLRGLARLRLAPRNSC